MRYVYLANNRLGRDALEAAIAAGRRPVGLVVHPIDRARNRDEIVALAGLPPDRVIEAPALRTPAGRRWLAALQPDWLVSVLFGYIVRPDVLDIPRRGAVNLHTALLPYNRGAYPNVWSIVDKTPAGVTLHHMSPDKGVDAGDIVAQREVPVSPTDTGASLYAKLERAALELLTARWPLLESPDTPRSAQKGVGTYHRVADVSAIDRIDPDQVVRAGDLIDILRARTFPPYGGAYLDLRGKRVGIRVELTELHDGPSGD